MYMAMPEEKRLQMPHQIILQDRRLLTISGVSDVDSFDGDGVVVYTNLGELTVKGGDLRINKLNVDTGELTLEGTVQSLDYADLPSKSGGFFGRLFK